MNKLLSLATLALLLLAMGCADQKFKKTKTGLEYKVVGGNGGNDIKYGNAIQFKAYSYYNDSLLSTPYDSVAQVIEVDSTKLPAEYVGIFTSSKKGDSIVTRMSTDTILKFNQLPPFAKKGQFLGYRFKIIDIITDPAKALSLKNEALQNIRKIDSVSVIKQKAIDDKSLSDYLAKNNIKASKSAKGTYVEIQNPGEGDAIDSGKAITVDYKGMTLDGKIFDQSYDASTGKSMKPFTFVVGQRGSIEGWSDGLVYFKKGGKGRLFIPSYLAYGPRGAGGDIKPNTPLMFEVSVVDVLTQDQYRTKMEAQQKMMQLQQQLQQKQNGMQQQPQQPPQQQGK
ncbi:MAG: FKBP-type peptidyl-prolyl cis-trans isomerase [Ginsengibacter sp.]